MKTISSHAKNTIFIFRTLSKNIRLMPINPLPHGVLATFNLTAGGLLRPPEEGDISREKTILMTSLQVL